ncbi:hypothetical protein TNCV_1558541 [Trichonephila clavipes]|uniref:Uncharacterized protein n=1 Tax=Trichonephila clavipes TaxID=2585209 RepID=A0A8X6RAZ1_TRICX|nr:hypothetical protein TNCV_1558541 [Trichonephila clavipes]
MRIVISRNDKPHYLRVTNLLLSNLTCTAGHVSFFNEDDSIFFQTTIMRRRFPNEKPAKYFFKFYTVFEMLFQLSAVAMVAEWYGYRIVAGFVTSSSPVPLKTHRVGQRCKLNLSRAETSFRSWWCGRGASSGVVHVT